MQKHALAVTFAVCNKALIVAEVTAAVAVKVAGILFVQINSEKKKRQEEKGEITAWQ